MTNIIVHVLIIYLLILWVLFGVSIFFNYGIYTVNLFYRSFICYDALANPSRKMFWGLEHPFLDKTFRILPKKMFT